MSYSLLVVIVIPFAFSWMTYNPLVQTFLARMAGSYLSEKLNTVITIDGLYITPRLNIHVRGVLTLDQRNDTLFHARDMFIDMRSFRFQASSKIFEVNDIALNDASFSLIRNVNDSAFTYSFIRDHFESTSPETDEDTIHGDAKWKVSLDALDLSKVRFRFRDETMERVEVGMDYTDLDIFVHDLRLKDLNILNDTFDFVIEKLRCRDKCGFVVDELSGDFRLSPLFLIADSLKVLTPKSDLDLDLAFNYDGWPSYINFIEEVDMSSSIRPSVLNLVDIGYFAPDLLVMDNMLRLGGEVKGTVDNLRVKDFRFTYGRNTRFRGDVRLYGLPDVAETFIHTSVDEFTLTGSDIEKFAIPGPYRHIPVPEELGVLGTMRISGSFTGFYNDFVSTADFVSDIGTLSTDISLRQNEDETDVVYEGEVRARRFHIGKFLNLDDYFGELDLDVQVNGKGLTAESANIHMNGSISSLTFMDQKFNQLAIRGAIAEKRFNGHLDLQDDLIKLVFDGILDFSQEMPLLDFTADILDADLYNLKLLDRDSVSVLSASLNCNFIGFDPEDLEGRIWVDSLEYIEGENSFFMEHLALISLKDTGYYRKIMLTSDMLDALVQGNFTIRETSHAINNMLEQVFSRWAFMPETDINIRPQSLAFSLDIKETDELLNIFSPGISVPLRSHIQGYFNSSGYGDSKISAAFPHIDYRGINSDSITILAYARDSIIGVQLNTDKIILKESSVWDTLELGIENFAIQALLNNDSLHYAVNWYNRDADQRNSADFKGYFTYTDSIRSELSFTTAMAVINDSLWTLSHGNRMVFGPRYLELVDFNIRGGKQELRLQGKATEYPADTLKVEFSEWRLSNFDIVYNNYDFDLNGVANGEVGVSSFFGIPNFFSGLYISDLEMNDVLIGDADIQSYWNNERQSVEVAAEVIYHGNLEDSKIISLLGNYYPLRDRNNLNFSLNMENLRLEAFNRFLDGYVSDLQGIASANMDITGSTAKPKLSGRLKLMRTSCRIDYLNTKYSFAHTIDFNPGLISIHNLVIFDSVGNRAVANGEITHKSFSDFYFNLNLKPADFIGLYTNRYHNEVFYGNGIVSGEVRFYGPTNDFHIDADLTTSRGAMITIPLNNTFTVTENDFVVFVGEEVEDKDAVADYNVSIKGLNLDFKIRINNTAEAMIFLPGNMGNISSRGHGDIRFTVNPRGEFNIYGDYQFLGGTFFFSLQNLINRRFEILPGGKIGFTGNPFNADVDFKALYRLKTSLSGLGASISPEYEGQRVNVNAYLGLKGKLANPDIHFSIMFPNVRDEIKTSIYAVLDTNDAMLMNQQMVSLLLMNSFSYASSSTNMSVSSLNIVTSQLSNWLSQISRDFDIGINYIAGDEMNQDELEVALSTQFFDNRLIIDGNVGVMTSDRENSSAQHASNIVGDVNIEYKLRPDGRIRVKAFNRSNNINTIDYYAPYTQGVGIFYTKEFDNFGDLFRRQRKKGESLEE